MNIWLSLLACKKVCIIAFLSRAVSNLPPFGEIVSHFRAYLTLYLERPIKCVVFICPQISVRFLLKTSIFTLIFLIRLSKISFRPHFCELVGLDGLEPSTSRLSGARSNHLSYRPLFLASFGIPFDSIFVTLLGSIRFLFVSHRVMCFKLAPNLPRACLRRLPVVEMKGIEPLTPCLQGRCSPS